MKIKLLSLLTIITFLIASCGHKTLKTKEDAINFLETNMFSSDNATVTGQSGGKLQSPFSLSFSNGNVKMGEESLLYTVDEINSGLINGINYFSGPGFIVKFCGSQRYAYGGCIECYLSAGINNDGSKSKYGPVLKVRGSYINTDFSDEEITKK